MPTSTSDRSVRIIIRGITATIVVAVIVTLYSDRKRIQDTQRLSERAATQAADNDRRIDRNTAALRELIRYYHPETAP